MHTITQTVPVSKPVLWTGRVLTALPILMVLFGSVVKLMKLPGVTEGFVRAGIPVRLMVPVGIIELICVVVYAIPRTAVLGAILMTGLLGAATFANLRFGDPTYPMPAILGMMVWGGLYLRDARLRALMPLRQPQG